MPSRSRQKGDREERAIVDAARSRGLEARRVPLSGSVDGYEGDVVLVDPVSKAERTIEAKHRADGFREIYKWLLEDHVDFLTVRADRRERLWIMREEDFFSLLGWGAKSE
jgi:Holliday junction resolvase